MNTTLVTIETEGVRRHFQLLGIYQAQEVMKQLIAYLEAKPGQGCRFEVVKLEHVHRAMPHNTQNVVELFEKQQEKQVQIKPMNKADLMRYLANNQLVAEMLEERLTPKSVESALNDPDPTPEELGPFIGVSILQLREILREVLPQEGELYAGSIGGFTYIARGRAAHGISTSKDTTWIDTKGRGLYAGRGLRPEQATVRQELWDVFTWALSEDQAVEHATAMHVQLIGRPSLWRHLHMLELPGMLTKYETVLRREINPT